MIVNYINVEGKHVYEKNQREVNIADFYSDVGFLLLEGVYRINNESVSSVWEELKRSMI